MEAEQRRAHRASGPRYWQPNTTVSPAASAEVPDRELVQIGRQHLLLEKIAGGEIDIDERRLHVGKVELVIAAVGMGFDAAIGDDHGAAVGEQRHVVRLHAARRELADLAIAVGRVAHADDALRVRVVVLGGVEQLAVGGEDAMAEEMPVGLRGEPDRLPPVGGHGDAEAAWARGQTRPIRPSPDEARCRDRARAARRRGCRRRRGEQSC